MSKESRRILETWLQTVSIDKEPIFDIEATEMINYSFYPNSVVELIEKYEAKYGGEPEDWHNFNKYFYPLLYVKFNDVPIYRQRNDPKWTDFTSWMYGRLVSLLSQDFNRDQLYVLVLLATEHYGNESLFSKTFEALGNASVDAGHFQYWIGIVKGELQKAATRFRQQEKIYSDTKRDDPVDTITLAPEDIKKELKKWRDENDILRETRS